MNFPLTGLGDGAIEALVRAPSGMTWPVVTLTLSALVVVGYAAIALDWYFHSKLPGRAEASAALARLRWIFLFCAVCTIAFHATDIPWIGWRLYDVALLLLVFYTWSFALRMPAFGRLAARLARIDELEQSAERYHEIAELLPHMVWTATGDGRVDFANRRWRQYTGDNRTWLEAIHPRERAGALETWRRSVSAREPFTMEARLQGLQTGGGDPYRTFVVKATPLAHGNAVLWLGACADIEDQKQLAEQKERQARQKSFFLNALSHDLRAPLHNVLLNAHLLKMSLRDPVELESVNMIIENAVAAGDLVTRLLEFARMGAEERNEMELVPLEPVLQQVIRRFAPSTEQKGLWLRYEGATDIAVRTDRQKLIRIVSNLIDNAIKYTHHGGITVEITASASDVAVRVTDTGIGISRENAPHLFDEFYQVDNHERDRSKGFGMGLAICRALADHIGAEIQLVSSGAGGSSFEIRFNGAAVGIGAGRGRRSISAEGDCPDPQAAGLCRV